MILVVLSTTVLSRQPHVPSEEERERPRTRFLQDGGFAGTGHDGIEFLHGERIECGGGAGGGGSGERKKRAPVEDFSTSSGLFVNETNKSKITHK